jgi:hypothetical protein
MSVAELVQSNCACGRSRHPASHHQSIPVGREDDQILVRYSTYVAGIWKAYQGVLKVSKVRKVVPTHGT